MSKLIILSELSKLNIIIYNISNTMRGFCRASTERLCRSCEFPNDEKYILIPQIKRAILSARLNVREGNVFLGMNIKNG